MRSEDIEIPEPCHADWDAMRPEAQGKFCLECRKTVHDLSSMTDELRGEYDISEDVSGVVITGVEDGSPAAEKRIAAGEVIVEVAQEEVSAPADVVKRIDELKKQSRKSVLLLLANPQGELRFVALRIEGMVCTSCEQGIGHALEKLDGVLAQTVDHEAGRAEVQIDANKVTPAQLVETVNALGYTAHVAE